MGSSNRLLHVSCRTHGEHLPMQSSDQARARHVGLRPWHVCATYALPLPTKHTCAVRGRPSRFLNRSVASIRKCQVVKSMLSTLQFDALWTRVLQSSVFTDPRCATCSHDDSAASSSSCSRPCFADGTHSPEHGPLATMGAEWILPLSEY